MKIKKGDRVQVIAGKDRVLGPSRVLQVLPADERVIVEGRNLVKKHKKGNSMMNTESRIEETEAPIHVSNVMLWSEKLEAPVRTQKRWVGKDGELFSDESEARASFGEQTPQRINKVRYSAKSEEIFE